MTGESPRCRFRLDNDSSDTFILPDGRKLGYAQYGSLTGRPILYLHGLACSRIEAAMFHDLGLELDARIISVDRPGIGWSSPQPGRTLLGFPNDLEHLAKYLDLNEYSVLGMSGGGPYALACAKALPPENLKSVSIVCGLGPPDIGMSGARLVNWVGFTFGWRICTSAVNRWFWRRNSAGRLELTDEQRLELLLHEAKSSARAQEGDIAAMKDAAVMMDEDFLRLYLQYSRESFGQGYDWVLQDAKLISRDFGFRTEDIRPDLPVHLWYGKFDNCVPLNHGVQIATRLGCGRAQLRVEDETHASISANCKKEILEALVKIT